jgi:hypothetical protein
MQWHISHPGLPDVMGPAVKILEGAWGQARPIS